MSVEAFESVSSWNQPIPSPVSEARSAVVDGVARRIVAIRRGRIRVVVDGYTASRKTSFAHELAVAVRGLGRSTLRVSFDDFKKPWRDAHENGYDRTSGEGYYRNSPDFETARDLLLRPAGVEGSGTVVLCGHDPLTGEDHRDVTVHAPTDSVLIDDSVFGMRREYGEFWDFRIWIDFPQDVTLVRGIERDTELEGKDEAERLHRGRYQIGEQLYVNEVNPKAKADIIIDNTDYAKPAITIRRGGQSVPDRIFADTRLAEMYDDIDGARTDLDHYEAILDEVGARRILDIGCGTGTLACRLAARGLRVTGLDPAAASLQVARSKPGAELVSWILGDTTTLPPLAVDAVTMTGNVAQVFLSADEWSTTLNAAHAALHGGGHLVFESRDPSYRGWEEWTQEYSISVSDTVAGRVEHWVELTDVALPLVSFRHSFRFLASGEVITSESTLRFRDRQEITASLDSNGFTIVDVRDALDRPGREFVIIARPTSG